MAVVIASILVLIVAGIIILFYGEQGETEPGMTPAQTSTTQPQPTTTTTVSAGLSMTSTTLSPANNPTASIVSSTTSTTTTTTTNKDSIVNVTITDCAGSRIEYEDGVYDCGVGYACNLGKVGRTYGNPNQMAYDACIREDKDLEEILKGPAANCTLRQEQKYRELCYINVASKVNDLTICDYILQSAFKDMCIARVAVVREDEGVCYEVDNNTLRASCVREIELVRIAKSQSP